MDIKNIKERIGFTQLLNLMDNEDLSQAGIEVAVIYLEDKDNCTHTLKVIQSLKNEEKVVLCICILPLLFNDRKTFMASCDRARKFQQIADGCMLLNQDTFSPEQGYTPLEANRNLNLLVFEIEQGLLDILGPGIPNIEPNSISEDLKDCCTFMVTRGLGCGECRIREAFQEAISPVDFTRLSMPSARKIIIKVLTPVESPLSDYEIHEFQKLLSTFPQHISVQISITSSDLKNDQLEIVMLGISLDATLRH